MYLNKFFTINTNNLNKFVNVNAKPYAIKRYAMRADGLYDP
jgi:hypothetical protein